MNLPNPDRLIDNTTRGMFLYGAAKAVLLWRTGSTAESITHGAPSASAFDRGQIAACEIILGWRDVAAREARAHGMSREEADAFIESVLERVQ